MARSELNELLRQSGLGDKSAFAELYRRSSSKLFGTCLAILRERSDSQDVLQEIYISIWLRSRSYDGSKASAMTWMLAVTRNKAIDKLRRRHPSFIASEQCQKQLIDPGCSPRAEAQANQEACNLRSCLSKLKPKHERSLRDAFFTGASYRELALLSKIPEATMKSQIRRSLFALRVSLGQLEGSAVPKR